MLPWLMGGLVIVVAIGIGVLFGGAPFVPTRRAWIEEALKLSGLGKHDVIVDLGSGNGAVLTVALARGAKRAIGYEVNPLLVWWSRVRLRRFQDRYSVYAADFFRSDLPADTTIVYMFQTDWVMHRINAYLLAQKSHLKHDKLKVVCFGFTIPEAKAVRKLNGMTLYEY